jgi:sugar phosphate permease
MRRLSVSNTVLLIICLMYLILYVDRVNISTAAPLIKAELDLSSAWFFRHSPIRMRCSS